MLATLMLTYDNDYYVVIDCGRTGEQPAETPGWQQNSPQPSGPVKAAAETPAGPGTAAGAPLAQSSL